MKVQCRGTYHTGCRCEQCTAAHDAMREALGELIAAYDSKSMMPPDKFPPLWEKAKAALALAKG